MTVSHGPEMSCDRCPHPVSVCAARVLIAYTPLTFELFKVSGTR